MENKRNLVIIAPIVLFMIYSFRLVTAFISVICVTMWEGLVSRVVRGKGLEVGFIEDVLLGWLMQGFQF